MSQLARFDIEKGHLWPAVVPHQITVLECRIPRILPIQVESFGLREVTKIHHRGCLVVKEEADSRPGDTISVQWWNEFQLLWTLIQWIAQLKVDDLLVLRWSGDCSPRTGIDHPCIG